MNFSKLWNQFVDNLPTYAMSIGKVILIIILGIIAVKIILKIMRKFLHRTKLDPVVISFIMSIAKASLYIAYGMIIVNAINLPLGSLATVFGAFSVVIGIALKDSTSSVASGVSIIVNKPFKQGDFVEIGGESGVVKAISMMQTQLVTGDNKTITIPNNKVNTSSIINYTNQGRRRAELTFSVSYDCDIELVKKTILKEVFADKRVLRDPEPFVFLKEQAASAVIFATRFWVDSEDFWQCSWDLNEAIFKKFRENAIDIPFDQLDVKIKNGSVVNTINQYLDEKFIEGGKKEEEYKAKLEAKATKKNKA